MYLWVKCVELCGSILNIIVCYGVVLVDDMGYVLFFYVVKLIK